MCLAFSPPPPYLSKCLYYYEPPASPQTLLSMTCAPPIPINNHSWPSIFSMSELTTEPKPLKISADEAEPRAEKPKRSNSWEAKNAIIYDALNQTLSKEKKANIDESAKGNETG